MPRLKACQLSLGFETKPLRYDTTKLLPQRSTWTITLGHRMQMLHLVNFKMMNQTSPIHEDGGSVFFYVTLENQFQKEM